MRVLHFTVMISAGLVVTACGNTVQSPTSAATGRGLASLGTCPAGTHVDGADPFEFASMPGAWVEVSSIDLTTAADKTLRKTERFGGTFRVVGGDASYVEAISSAPSPLRMHGSIASEIDAALRLGAAVTIHTGAKEDPRYLAFAMADLDGEVAFLGQCQDTLLTQPMRRRLGPGAPAALRGLVGKAGADVHRALVPAGPAAPPKTDPVLRAGRTDPGLLGMLRAGRVEITPPPESWRGANTVCTRIAKGWNECLDLSLDQAETQWLTMYYDPADPVVEVWLLNQAADVARPIVRLGRYDLAALAATDGADLTGSALTLRVSLATTPSLGDVKADARNAGHAVASTHVRNR